jgi:hypothetical protein
MSEAQPQRVTCRAKSKQSGEGCRKPPTPGKTLCTMHGSKREGVPNLERMKHGERSAYVPRAILPEVVAELAAIKADPSLPVATNLAERRVRRRGLDKATTDDLFIVGTLDTHDRSDVGLLLKAAELERASAAPPAAPTIVLGDITRVVLLPVADGHARAMQHPDDPTVYLIEDKATGAWTPARSTTVDGYEQYQPTHLLPEGQSR